MILASDFFRRVRAAAEDAESCRRQLARLEARELSLGGGVQGSRVRSTPDPHAMERRVVAYADREEALRVRMEADYDVIDLACSVLYGPEQDGRGGVSVLCGPLAADVLWWRYLDGATWDGVCAATGHSPSKCRKVAAAALSRMERTGALREEMGRLDAIL